MTTIAGCWIDRPGVATVGLQESRGTTRCSIDEGGGRQAIGKLLVFGLIAHGCATGRAGGQTSWEEDTREGISSPPPPKSAQKPASSVVLTDDQEPPKQWETVEIAGVNDPPPPIEEVAAKLELSMLRFTSEVRLLNGRYKKKLRRRKRRRSKPRREGWPAAVQALWKRMLDELHAGLAVAPDELVPKRMLLQARVTTEAEKEMADELFGKAPAGLAWRISDLHITIARLMRRNAEAESVPGFKLHQHGAPPLAWPVSPQIFTSFFGHRKHPISGVVKFHTGVDLGGRRGDLVGAAAEGTVVHAGWAGGYGRMVVLQHASGYQTVYGHLKRIRTKQGAIVKQGATIGEVGNSGRSTGPHLHFEVRHGGQPVDPMKLMGSRYAAELEQQKRKLSGARGGN